MKKNFYHGEHGGHGGAERGLSVEFFEEKQAVNFDPNKKNLFFPSVFSVSSVVKPLSAFA